MDPQLTNDGKPYGPWRYKELVRERYYISKTINTSYSDTGQLTPIEREYILEFITEEIMMAKKKAEEIKAQNKK